MDAYGRILRQRSQVRILSGARVGTVPNVCREGRRLAQCCSPARVAAGVWITFEAYFLAILELPRLAVLSLGYSGEGHP